jgi:hypothetical protein
VRRSWRWNFTENGKNKKEPRPTEVPFCEIDCLWTIDFFFSVTSRNCIILAIAESAGQAEMLENNGACQISLGKWCELEKNEEK